MTEPLTGKGRPMDEAGILRKIREKIDAGTLPREAALRTWGKISGGDNCGVCDEMILLNTPEILAESADGQERAYHPICYNHLAAERLRLAG